MVRRRAPGTNPSRGMPPFNRWAVYSGAMSCVSTQCVLYPPAERGSCGRGRPSRGDGRLVIDVPGVGAASWIRAFRVDDGAIRRLSERTILQNDGARGDMRQTAFRPVRRLREPELAVAHAHNNQPAPFLRYAVVSRRYDLPRDGVAKRLKLDQEAREVLQPMAGCQSPVRSPPETPPAVFRAGRERTRGTCLRASAFPWRRPPVENAGTAARRKRRQSFPCTA